jgi:hypothetical protein
VGKSYNCKFFIKLAVVNIPCKNKQPSPKFAGSFNQFILRLVGTLKDLRFHFVQLSFVQFGN